MSRVYNFSAGPAVLPEEVLREAADEMMDYQGSGMSVMEMSHRSKTYDKIIKDAEADLRDLMNIPDNYKVLFLQGGASQQFAMIPMNLMKNKKAGFIVTGQWAKKAYQEASIYGEAVKLASSEDKTFSYIPDCSDLDIPEDLDYVYICENNTIYGTKFWELPNTKGHTLVADVSSCFLSEPVDVSKYGIIYGGVQKNIGPAGVVIVIIREDLITEDTLPGTPTMLKYKIHADNESLYNTPPAYGIYICGKVFKWLKKMGGLEAMKKHNEEKAKILYDFLDESKLFKGTVEKKDRSLMNVPFVTGNEELDAKFVKEAKAAGFEYDTTAEVDAHIEMIETSAADAEMTVKDYVKASLGQYATLKNLRPIIEESYYASAYYNDVIEGLEVTEDEITNYYNENKADYDSVDFKLITVEAEIPEGEKTTDAEGNTTTADPTEEEVSLAMKNAKLAADEKVAALDSEGELKENVKYAFASTYYADWLFDDTRKAGDTTVIENSTANCYYVLKFEDRYLDETKSVNIRAIATTSDMGATIVDEWKNTGANEDAFIALVEKYSEDSYTNTTGGLYENLQSTNLSEELSAWLLDDARKAGDVEAIPSTSGYYYVMYYLGQGDAEWKAAIDSLLRSEDMAVYMDEIMKDIEIVDTKGKLTYEEALEAAESAAAASKEASTEATE